MKRSLILFLFIGIAYPQSMQISDSEIRYHGIHPLHEWTGISTSASGKVNYDQSTNLGSITVSVPLNSFDSRVYARDSNMLTYTEAIDFPLVTFKSDNASIKQDSLYVNGRLTFHGITRDISVVASITRQNGFQVNGEFSINLSDYNVQRPTLLFIKIDDKIRIDYEFIIKP
tara:strand:- start:730 stop:1245 length:516 start_codon:yes stop_codon:yes gene_type:complete